MHESIWQLILISMKPKYGWWRQRKSSRSTHRQWWLRMEISTLRDWVLSHEGYNSWSFLDLDSDLFSVNSVLSLTFPRHATKGVVAGVVWEASTRTKGVFMRLHCIIRLSAHDLTHCWLYTLNRYTSVCLATTHQKLRWIWAQGNTSSAPPYR